MAIKILHTADIHIGMKFSNKPAQAREALINERFSALQRLVDIGNTDRVNFIVIAGDLFDSTTVRLADIKATVDILNTFTGESVIVLPGNHDFFESTAESLWTRFKQNIKDDKVIVLSQYEVFTYEVGETKVNFYPACCYSKHSRENVIGWVKDAAKNKELNIGIAHGNVTGLGLDMADQYFNMSQDELKECDMDFWLLGHIHVSYPTIHPVTENPGMFMAGAPTPDGWNRKHKGSAWLIEISDNKNVRAKLIAPGKLRFFDWVKTVKTSDDVQRLKADIKDLIPRNSLLRITVQGQLSEEEIRSFNGYFEEKEREFLLLEFTNHIGLYIDAALINSKYTPGSLPHMLLSELLNDESEEVAVQLAYELIKNQETC